MGLGRARVQDLVRMVLSAVAQLATRWPAEEEGEGGAPSRALRSIPVSGRSHQLFVRTRRRGGP